MITSHTVRSYRDFADCVTNPSGLLVVAMCGKLRTLAQQTLKDKHGHARLYSHVPHARLYSHVPHASCVGGTILFRRHFDVVMTIL